MAADRDAVKMSVANVTAAVATLVVNGDAMTSHLKEHLLRLWRKASAALHVTSGGREMSVIAVTSHRGSPEVLSEAQEAMTVVARPRCQALSKPHRHHQIGHVVMMRVAQVEMHLRWTMADVVAGEVAVEAKTYAVRDVTRREGMAVEARLGRRVRLMVGREGMTMARSIAVNGGEVGGTEKRHDVSVI